MFSKVKTLPWYPSTNGLEGNEINKIEFKFSWIGFTNIFSKGAIKCYFEIGFSTKLKLILGLNEKKDL